MNKRLVWALALIPITGLILSLLMVSSRGPYYFGANSDPEYCYLFNSLNLLTFHTPAHIDHPGTTVQMLGAVVVFLKWIGGFFVGRWQPLPETVLSQPEDFLHLMNFFFNVLIALALFFAARSIYRASGCILAALVFQLSYFLFLQTVLVQGRVSPEPLLVATALALAIPLAPLLSPESYAKGEAGPRPVATGLVCGFGLVTKITFMPLLAVLLLFPGGKQKARVLLVTAATAAVLILPILPNIPRMANWFLSLLTHTGRYGSGPAGVPKTSELWTNLTALLTVEPFLLVHLVFYALVLIAIYFAPDRGAGNLARNVNKIVGVVCLAILLQIVITVKHYAAHYVVPALLTTAIANAAIVVLLRSPEFRRLAGRILILAGSLLFAIGLIYNGSRIVASAQAAQTYQRDVKLLQKNTISRGCTVVASYGSSLQTYALAFGNGFSAAVHGPVLEELYPNVITYDYFGAQFLSFTMQPRRAQIKKLVTDGQCVIVQSMPLTEAAAVGLRGFQVEKAALVANETLYRLGPAGSNLLSQSEVPANAVIIEAEKFSAGNVVVDTTFYGAGIGVITSPRVPAFAEYSVRLASAGPYEFRVRCASQDPRPLTLVINGKPVSGSGCADPTEGYDPAHQYWQAGGVYDFQSGANTVRLERSGPFPHVDKFCLIPRPK